MRSKVVAISCAVVAIVLLNGRARGSVIAFDTAGDSAYNNGWAQGSNGGFGWGGAWSFIGPGSASIGSDPNDGGALNSPADQSGRAWRLSSTVADRQLSDYFLSGETISIDLDDAQGIHFGLVHGNNNVYEIEGGTTGDYQLVLLYNERGPSSADMHIPVVNGPVRLSITNEAYIDYLISFTPLSPGAVSASGRFASLPPANEIQIGTGFPSDVLYANNLSVTPEPSTACFCAVLGLGLLGRRRR